MKKVIVILILSFLSEQISIKSPISGNQTLNNLAVANNNNRPKFRCDGRTHCSQMTSCAEATFFLRNCPNVKMDGDGDGVPCESQWCGKKSSEKCWESFPDN
ncbi:MAG: excalibur calcium-binding domain-containing protein [Microcystis aeruginosa Ma_MB_F_20061100_S19]|uniref:Excalibur calcium-binding domain protein n=1 Tax=Microcystis aeruginosa SPC777 TaxID=482300 RepID=S3JFR9_MICAE|nr:excalibur calcium-binding domain-containing protein [Microcystis aeruginosa]NCR97354.1 excalibur calcium-binding domain-containing protein [Microcystis aeruginosa L311-01]OCY13613.1 MAG: DNA-binding protein [Microcystis aeruginosa CACIAM 03]TRU04910.1 MAG: excalibur calcium-binding domain-containing protein [Microcystis aeruginosa Ma_MB_F_20061100_S19D]TRU13812.1 MAG: excalibur calcium-binding domain-containing protein [Microcystis aeruginosa Ma_MB_F_20061100_S19]EPF21158.1 Excalibur calciu